MTNTNGNRAAKAALLKVFQAGADYFVESSKGKILYKVVGENGYKTCTCADYATNAGKHEEYMCKHILAVINGNGNGGPTKLKKQKPNLRTLKPMDIDTVAESVKKTGRLVTVSEGFGMAGVGPEIVRQVIEYKFSDGRCGFDYLDGPPVNMAAADVPPPMSEPLELASIPSVERIVAALKSIV